MNLRQLEALYFVVNTGSVSEAAKGLERTQPAVTALIRGLEDSVGMPLFERRGGRLLLLPEARYVYEEAKEILKRLNRARTTMDALRSSERGTLRVASGLSMGLSLLPAMINEVLRESDNISASLVTGSPVHVHDLVASQQVDIGVAYMGFTEMLVETTLLNHRSFKMSAVVAAAADDPLASRDIVTLQDLSGRGLAILGEGGPFVYQAVEKAFLNAGAAFKPRLFTQTTMPQFIPIREGSVVAIVDPVSARAYLEYCGSDGGVCFKPLKPEINVEMGVLTPAFRPPSQLSKSFEEMLLARIPSLTSL